MLGAGQMLSAGQRGSGRHNTTCSRSADQTTMGGRRGRRRKTLREEELQCLVKAPLADTKSVFVCLPGCQIKEFLCVPEGPGGLGGWEGGGGGAGWVGFALTEFI